MPICQIFSAYRRDYIFRSIDVFYVYLTDLICTVYSKLFYGKNSRRYDENKTFRGKFAPEIFIGLEKATEKNAQMHRKKIPEHLRRFAASHNVYLPENSPKLKTVW